MARNKRKAKRKLLNPHHWERKKIQVKQEIEKEISGLIEKGKKHYAPKIGRLIKKATERLKRYQ